MAEMMEAPQCVKDIVNRYLNTEGSSKMPIDKGWRPNEWDQIKQNIITETPITFSPSAGFSPDQKDQLMEKAASAILGAYLSERVEEIPTS